MPAPAAGQGLFIVALSAKEESLPGAVMEMLRFSQHDSRNWTFDFEKEPGGRHGQLDLWTPWCQNLMAPACLGIPTDYFEEAWP